MKSDSREVDFSFCTSEVISINLCIYFLLFSLQIKVYEGDERFWLRLIEPTGSSSPVILGPQRTTVITIRDNDQPLTG